jgi:hypothetical protein
MALLFLLAFVRISFILERIVYENKQKERAMAKFQKGWAGGPGRPLGSRNKSTLILDAIGSEGVEETIRMVKRKVDEHGSLYAADILLARTWPRGRRPVAIDLPVVKNAEDIVQAFSALIAAVAAGEVTPDEASSLSNLLEHQRRSLETYDHEKRLRAWEAEKAAAA